MHGEPYVFQPFPSFRYRRAADGGIESKLVHDAGQDERETPAFEGWCHTPADVDRLYPVSTDG